MQPESGMVVWLSGHDTDRHDRPLLGKLNVKALDKA
jgi:hypothetical protein